MVLDLATHAKVKQSEFAKKFLILWMRDNGTMIDFIEAFDLVPLDQQITKIAALGLDMGVDVGLREFSSGHSQRFRVAGHLYVEVTVTSGAMQGSVLGPHLFLMYVNDIWMYMGSTIRLFTGDCIIHRKITDGKDAEKLQIDLDRLRDWG